MASKPNIRFNDFSDEWEEIELNKIAERITRKNTNLESTLPLTISAQYGLVDQRDFFNAQIASKDVSGYFLLKKGEFAYNKSYSSEYPFGTIKRLDKYEMGVLSTLYILFSHKNINSDFLLHYYDSNYWHNEITKIAAEGARNHGLLNIAPEDFFNTKLKVTKNENEQKVIGLFFTQITSLIDSTQEKLEKTIILKKSMLEKMFPKDGAKAPELRFAGFTDDWKEKELGKYAEKITEKNTDNQYSDVFTNSAEYGIISQNEYFEREIANKNNLSGYYVAKPDVFVYNPRVSKTAPVGPIKRNKLGRIGVLSPLYFVFQTHDYDLTFLDYFFDGNTWHQFMRDNGNTGARFDRFSINEDSFLKMPIPTPSREEQKQIGTFFVQMDSLIYSYRNELEKLKTIKKSLLEKMFV